ncbi:DUF2171 domain-containing protein [Roseomonas sp. JC162]|uniref:DUF2171 domain-containing protein n=1 Tax=Neoroseomonas marina TaxID=1232220 RepID=A0A848E9R1_9PROT|nr:DUF2171 domain-containing protein [Neoroseomonas marina]
MEAPVSSSLSKITEHMAVVGSDGQHVGTVDKVEGNRIKLTKSDDPDGTGQHHHFLSAEMVSQIEGGAVRLNVPANEAKKAAMGSGAA